MTQRARVLILEDLASDAELLEAELRRAGLRFDVVRATDRPSFLALLEESTPDIVLADYSIPGFSGMDALTHVKERFPEIPFVFVSGALGEERAIETLKGGATDYVLKDRLSRLGPAVRRALAEAKERRARAQAEREVGRSHEALRRSEATQRVLLEITNAAITAPDRSGLWRSSARALRRLVPFERASLVLLEGGGTQLRISTVVAEEGDLLEAIPEGIRLPLEDAKLERVVSERRTILRHDLSREAETRVERQLLHAGIRSYLSVPLLGKRGVLGTLNVGSTQPERYGTGDARLLSAAANQIGLAVENILAYEEVQDLRQQLELENVYLREEVQESGAFGEIIGTSAAIREVEEKIEQVAPTSAAVLIMGESGTGKELVAREIHARSPRSGRPLIKVNCAAVPRELYESEFFGHVEGAFSGAIRDREGRFAAADGGTLFLDEVGEIPLELQAKLLRVLQDGTFQRVGEERTREVDVRVLAATNRDLHRQVREGRFREDLFYRINVFPIHVPPLRDRRNDIPLLAAHFLREAGRRLNPRALERGDLELSAAMAADLMAYEWPGNVRELRNVVERAVITARRGRLGFDLPSGAAAISAAEGGDGAAGRGGERPVIPEREMQRMMRENILKALERTGGKIYGEDGAAALLGIPPTTLSSRMKSLGIER
jgi:transcriptional regulator with GAF, ATPase, and Fis domain